MEIKLVEIIRDFLASHSAPNLCDPALQSEINEAEQRLGFLIPSLLKACYLNLSNGGFGPGYGVIGVEGGYASVFGSITETYDLLKSDQEAAGLKWQQGLLPFCEWGCNIFSCVDCSRPPHVVYQFENFTASRQNYDLDKFFELWMDGVDILSYGVSDSEESEEIEFTNPFTGKKDTISKRRVDRG